VHLIGHFDLITFGYELPEPFDLSDTDKAFLFGMYFGTPSRLRVRLPSAPSTVVMCNTESRGSLATAY
jgi:hypothetical protein